MCLVQVDLVVSSPLQRALGTANAVAEYQSIDGSPRPEVHVLQSLTDRDWGSSEGRLAQEVGI